MALHTISAKSVVQVLFHIISQVGMPKEILTDQGMSFMFKCSPASVRRWGYVVEVWSLAQCFVYVSGHVSGLHLSLRTP